MVNKHTVVHVLSSIVISVTVALSLPSGKNLQFQQVEVTGKSGKLGSHSQVFNSRAAFKPGFIYKDGKMVTSTLLPEALLS